MKSTFKVLFYVKRNAIRKDGKMPIVARITVDGHVAQFNTKLEIQPDNWSVKMGKAIGQSSDSKKLNALLNEINASVHKNYHELRHRDNYVTAEKVKNEFLGISDNFETLLDIFQKHNEDTLKLVGISKSAATYQKYEVTRKHLQKFLLLKYKLADISLKEIKHMFLCDFEIYLMTTAGCNANTTAKFMQFFKRIILIARNNGLITIDPFANYKIRLAKVDRGYLPQEDIEKLLKKQFSTKRLELVRDIFVFSCFTGLAYIDVKNLTDKSVRTSFDGKLWIMTKRQKTNVQSNILLLDVPKMILEKYKGKSPDNKLLPILSNQKMNAYLKEIGDLCEIDKELTFHLARHTFATTVTLAKGVPIETVSKMLGHTNIKTTQIYARITDSKISNDMQELAGKLEGIEKMYKI
ncbi:MAG: site-specific integrase [Paludibacter sp.]|nr:site-specific integrase [Paludibacter sp.]